MFLFSSPFGTDLSNIADTISANLNTATKQIYDTKQKQASSGGGVYNQPISNHNGSSSSGGFNYQNYYNYAPIPAPNLDVELTPEELLALAAEAQAYGDLAFNAAFQSADEEMIANTKQAEELIDELNPNYWEAMRDTTANASNLIGKFLQNTNQLGRLRSGQTIEGAEDIYAAGASGRNQLESELQGKIYDVGEREKEVEQEILRFKTGLEKEKGLSIALKKESLKREQIDREVNIRQQTFQNRLASASSTREWEQLNMAYNEFKFNTEQLLWERGITEQKLASELQAQQLQNQLVARSLSGGSGVAEAEYWGDSQHELMAGVAGTLKDDASRLIMGDYYTSINTEPETSGGSYNETLTTLIERYGLEKALNLLMVSGGGRPPIGDFNSGIPQ